MSKEDIVKYELVLIRPDYYTDSDFEFYQKFFDFIDKMIDDGKDIQVNQMYPHMKSMCINKQKYSSGGGYWFAFWSNNINELKELLDYCITHSFYIPHFGLSKEYMKELSFRTLGI